MITQNQLSLILLIIFAGIIVTVKSPGGWTPMG